MEFIRIFCKNNVQEAYLPTIVICPKMLIVSILGQIVSEILAQIYSDDSIQILLNLTWV